MTAYALIAASVNTIAYKFVEGFEWPTAWVLVGFILEVTMAWFFYGLTGSVRRAVAVQFLLCLLLRMLNAGKIHFLNTPFLPSDLFLIEEVYRVTPIGIFLFMAAAVSAPLLLSVILLVIKPCRPDQYRAFGMIPFTTFLVILTVFPQRYSDTFDKLLENELYGIPFLMEERQQALGVPLSFSIDTAKFLAVFQYNPTHDMVISAVNDIRAVQGPSVLSPARVPPLLKRNVYIVAVESFWDPTWLIDVGDAIGPRFRALWKENGGLHLLSPMFGGGTANVEFEILCGIPSRIITKGIIFQVSLANEVPCLPSVLRDQGYHAFAFHGFEGSYFNRNVAFPSLGFESFDAVEDLLAIYEKGSFVSDVDLFDEAMHRTKEYAKGAPYLSYIMTFAGHWPYAWLDKYPQVVRLKDAEKDSKVKLLERHLNINRYSSDEVVNLIERIGRSDPDGLVVVFGDHLPALGLSGQDPNMNDWRFYQTPLLIIDRWENTKPSVKYIPAYALTSEILRRMGIPEDKQGYIPLVKPPERLIVRPEQNNSTFVGPETASDFKSCTPQSTDADCVLAFNWLANVRIIGRDLVIGSQKVRTTFPKGAASTSK